MYISTIKIVKHSRDQVRDLVKDLTTAQWMAIPEGHDNNIAWNIGHLTWGLLGLTYGHTNLEMPIDRTPYTTLYGIGTSPATWTSDPNRSELMDVFMSLPDKVLEDATAGIFDDAVFEPWSTGAGAKFETLADMMIYNCAHEGEHRGMIMALKNLVAG